MAGDIKKLEAKYKRLSADIKDCTAKNFTTLEKRMKFLRFDTSKGYDALHEAVGSTKGDNFEFSKIEDYAKERKETAGILKFIKSYQGKQAETWKEIEFMEKRALGSEFGLKKLAKEIDKLGKDSKDIKKLQDQIDSDLKAVQFFCKKVKSVPAIHRDPSKVYDSEIKKALNARPIISKYGKDAAPKLIPKKLKANHHGGLKSLKEFEALADEVEAFPKSSELDAKQKKELNLKMSECVIKRQDILDISDEYTSIKKKFQRDIDNAADGKKIEKEIKKFASVTDDANKRYKALKVILKDRGHKVKGA